MADFTKKAIKEAFIKLLDEQPLNQITVRNIVEECGINRNSFYYHFQDIPTLIEEIVIEKANYLIEEYPTINSLEECFDMALKYAIENKRAVMHIYNSVSRDLFEQHLMKLCEHVVTTYVNTVRSGDEIDEKDKEILIKFIKYECFGAFIAWLNAGMKDGSLSDLHRLLRLCHGIPDEIIKRSLTNSF